MLSPAHRLQHLPPTFRERHAPSTILPTSGPLGDWRALAGISGLSTIHHRAHRRFAVNLHFPGLDGQACEQ